MRRYISKCKTAFMLLTLLGAMIIPGAVADAKTINKTEKLDKEISYVGNEIYVYNATSIKINKKSTSKYKKKIKTVKTDTDQTGFCYQTKPYCTNSNAYSQFDDYKNATENAIKYVAENDYTLRFLKAGTYTIYYTEYSKEYLNIKWSYTSGKYYIYDSDGNKVTSEGFEYKSTNSGEVYFQGVSSKKIYALSKDFNDYDNYGYVAASIKTGADGKQHVFCQPHNLIKTTYEKQYKVLKTKRAIKSVQLGSTKLTRADSQGAYSSSSSSQRTFLSSKKTKGKLTVTMADKNYSITSIIVKTYDKDGKPVYTKVGNKNTVNFGLNKSMGKYNSPYGSYSSSYTSLYKPTTVYVSYKNKYTGAFYRVNSITKDAYGNNVFSVTYRYSGDTKDTTYTTSDLPDSYTESYTFYKK